MNLSKYDGKCVQIIDKDNIIYEGYCIYNDKEYSLHEFGREEDNLEIQNILFYKSRIKKVIILDKYTKPFGEIEKLIVEFGIDDIKEVFENEDEDEKYRLLCYLETISISDEIKEFLQEIIKNNLNKKLLNKAKSIIKSK